MKLPRVALLLCVSAATCFADIQDPPMHDQNAIRKLSRGLANVAFGSSELFASIDVMGERHGNSGAYSYGLISGIGRTLARLGVGYYEIMTFAVPTTRGSYASPLPAATPWVQNGFEEFPPELGFESRFPYSRIQGGYTRIP